jgi:hypothetical protein
MLNKSKELYVMELAAENPLFLPLINALNALKIKEGITSALKLYSKVVDVLYFLLKQDSDESTADAVNAMLWVVGQIVVTNMPPAEPERTNEEVLKVMIEHFREVHV